MIAKTEFEKDLENLKQMQAKKQLDELQVSLEGLEGIAEDLAIWRQSDRWLNKQNLAWYGRDSDLDRLVHDKNPYVRAAVADRKRDCDLDVLVNDPEANVRATVAAQGRDKDLDKLVSDEDALVRRSVARVGRDKDLDKLVDDPEADVREEVAWQGRKQARF